ncbi:MAG TPA: hypothetical protein VID29_04330 [Solirubrobacteraceae bacterium]
MRGAGAGGVALGDCERCVRTCGAGGASPAAVEEPEPSISLTTGAPGVVEVEGAEEGEEAEGPVDGVPGPGAEAGAVVVVVVVEVVPVEVVLVEVVPVDEAPEVPAAAPGSA